MGGRAAVEAFGPDDFFQTKKAVEAHFDTLRVEQILALLRLSGWEPKFLHGCVKVLLAKLPKTSQPFQRELRRAVD